MPMFVDVRGYRVLVLGGGREGTKKAKRFLSYGAAVTVYSLEFSEELRRLADDGRVKLVRGDVRDSEAVERLIRESDIVVYTVPDLPEVEDAVSALCRKLRKLYVMSTDASKSQVAIPVEARVCGLRVAVTSEGKSTLAAKYALGEIVKALSGRRDVEVMLEALWFAKRYMKSAGIHYRERMRLYHAIYGDEAFRAAVARGDLRSAVERVKELVRRAG